MQYPNDDEAKSKSNVRIALFLGGLAIFFFLTSFLLFKDGIPGPG